MHLDPNAAYFSKTIGIKYEQIMISPHTQGKSGKLIEYIELFARERVVIQYLNCMLRLASGGLFSEWTCTGLWSGWPSVYYVRYCSPRNGLSNGLSDARFTVGVTVSHRRTHTLLPSAVEACIRYAGGYFAERAPLVGFDAFKNENGFKFFISYSVTGTVA